MESSQILTRLYMYYDPLIVYKQLTSLCLKGDRCPVRLRLCQLHLCQLPWPAYRGARVAPAGRGLDLTQVPIPCKALPCIIVRKLLFSALHSKTCSELHFVGEGALVVYVCTVAICWRVTSVLGTSHEKGT